MKTKATKTLNALIQYWRIILWIVYHKTISCLQDSFADRSIGISGESQNSSLPNHYFAATCILSRLIGRKKGSSYPDLQAQIQKDVKDIQASYERVVLLENETDINVVQSRDGTYRIYLRCLVTSVFYSILADCVPAYESEKLLSSSRQNKDKAMRVLERMGGIDCTKTRFSLDEAVITRSLSDISDLYRLRTATDEPPKQEKTNGERR